MSKKYFFCWYIFTLLAVSHTEAQKSTPLFTLLKPDATGIRFTNKVREDDSLHVLVYEYLYNGHGIGIADFNNDGLQDVFISGNATPNKLFLNKGSLKFDDITKVAAVAGNGTWSTGVSIADVNGDGLADIYVCHSGKFKDAKLSNELFINTGITDGKPVFKEQAKLYGLDAPGTQSTQAAFFDYDHDGDLDMFLLNHSTNTYYAFLNTRKQRATPDLRYGNRLFRNDKQADGSTIYTDVTLKAGIINNPLNYGLSVNISDVNQDGWPDIYTTSDYSEHDCYYVNNKNGTFTQALQKSFSHISKFSMGADIADFNNDALPDVFTLDMLPADNHRQKLLKGPDEYDAYHLLLDSGYYRQNMRNMLQLNRGTDANGNVRFSEIGQFANVSNTDWSWAGLFADLDSDGWKDLVITNGYLRDFTDLDFLKYTMADAQLEAAAKGNLNFKTYSLVQKMPSNKLSNYIFRNQGDLTFQDITKDWGFSVPSISNAAAYADLDNDGDLDLVIGNNNEPVMVWRNNAAGSHHWLQVQLKGSNSNTAAFGTKLWLYADNKVQYQELYPVRGFQSCVSPVVYFGMHTSHADSMIIEWPSGKKSAIREVTIDKLLTLVEETTPTVTYKSKSQSQKKLFTQAPAQQQIPFRHQENNFVDFKVEVLLPYQLSKLGPALATGDVNGDGLEDIFIGGAIEQSAQLYLQNSQSAFSPAASQPWGKYTQCENVNALFFDADGDKDLDLYVVHGGNEYLDGSPEFQDILYLNDGKGNFEPALKALPRMLGSKQAIAASDFDQDGDLDLFVGGRGKSGYFPEASRSYILRNDSRVDKVAFTNVTKEVSEQLELPGMVTVAAWADLDNDKFPELVMAGEWMPVMIFKNTNGKLTNTLTGTDANSLYGLWSAIHIADIDNDGDRDILLGNCGTNNQFKPSEQEPMTMHVSDFDGNGNIDPIICYYIQGKSYPLASRDELLDQIPVLKKKYIKYTDYADATIQTIFTKEQLAKARVYKCTEARSIALINNSKLSFSKKILPSEVQFSNVHSILTDDLDNDGKTDIIITGNSFTNRTQFGDNDASLGIVMKGKDGGEFETINPSASGLFADGDVRAASVIKDANHTKKLVIVKNNDAVQILTIQQP
ncbi:VCBS repeat-containing protein [Ohtaekwangia kribbensis]|uniref:VCBS repeat-containing protein n=1 Tax=Ohtaekwangia kribbensis TaxID=688913 RepID=A0ABW3K054_9BACT